METASQSGTPIGIFDSGYGGLTVFKSIVERLPDYHYLYLGDNARSPYGDHSFETVYQYTLECVEWLFAQGCRLVILACNTASAKALRSIQQQVLPLKYPDRRVLGVIRPTAEVIGQYTQSGKIGVMGTRGTIHSDSYRLEIAHFFPQLDVFQQSCPMWVPLIENGEHLDPGADYFVQKYLDALMMQAKGIDCILLACTHYPLLLPKIAGRLPGAIRLLTQGDIVAASLQDYLSRHPEITQRLEKGIKQQFFTTGDAHTFNAQASVFLGKEIEAKHTTLPLNKYPFRLNS